MTEQDPSQRLHRSFYDRQIAPRLVSGVCGCGLCGRQRTKIVPHADGTVVEIGIGSGHNLPLYAPSKVKNVIGVDPDPVSTALGTARIAASGVSVEILNESAEATSLESGIADTVVTTYAFCTIPDDAAAMTEVTRLLKPTGRLLFCEHGRSNTSRTAALQDRINPYWKRLAGGCNLNRDMKDTMTSAGLVIETCDTYVPRFIPAFVGFHYVGSARLSA